MLITDWHSVHFINLVYFRPFGSILVQFGLLQSTSIQFGPFGLLRSIQSNSVYSKLVWSIQTHSVYFGQSSPARSIRSIQSTLIYLVQFGPYGQRRSIQSSQFCLVRSIRSNLVHKVHLGLFSSIWFRLFRSIGPIWSIRST